MSTLILAFFFMLTVVGAMAIGVLMGRAPISGSCGGMKALGMDMECEICGGNPALCDSDEQTPQQTPVRHTDDVDSLTKRVGR